MRGVYLFIGIAHCVCIWCKTHNVFQIEKYYNKFILTSFCIHNNTKSYFNIASLYSVPADWEAIFAEISIVKHVELIDTAAPAKTRQCCVLSLWLNMRSLFENYLLRLGNTWTSSWGWKDTKKCSNGPIIIQTQLLVFKSQELPTEKWFSWPEKTMRHTTNIRRAFV